MIKINLLRNLGMQAGAAPASVGDVVSSDVQKQAGIKLAVILAMPVLLFAYEKFNISVMQAELEKISAKIQAIEGEKAGFGTVAPRVDAYTKEKQAIERQLDAVRAITKNRLREVKALDALQSLIPEGTWFKDLEIDAGTVKLSGLTTSEEGVSNLIRALEGSVFFSRIIPKTTVQVELPGGGAAKKFELEFKVGKQE